MASSEPNPKRNWQPLAFGVVIVALLIVGMLMRLHQLGLPFDRDGYDEGVYWQTLMAIADGKQLYQGIFCSQPPAFLLTIYPIFMLLGKTIWAARLGIAIISIVGLIGVAVLGDALAGRGGAVAGVVLLLVSPAYLMQSQTLQGEAPSLALSLLSVGLAYQWWKTADEKAGYYFAVLSGIALSCSIFIKLLGAYAFVPLGILSFMRMIQLLQRQKGERLRGAYSLIAAVVAFLIASIIWSLPLFQHWPEFFKNTVLMHTKAQEIFRDSQQNNTLILSKVLLSPLGIAALCGVVLNVKQRDWRLCPLVGWVIATIWVLWMKVPLFEHYLSALIPPLTALVILGIIGVAREKTSSKMSLKKIIPYAIVGVIVLVNSVQISGYYQNQKTYAMAQNVENAPIITDLQNSLSPDHLVITDAPFLAASANRRMPAPLVDTSMVRIMTGFVTTEQLIKAASKPQVGAVLFYSGRFNLKNTESFHTWVARHYRLTKSYGNGKELWVKQN